MKNLIILFLLATFLTGCGAMRRQKETNENQNTSITTSATTTTIQEKVDTSVLIKRDSVVAVRPLDDLLNGKPIKATDGKNTVRVTYDKKSGDIRAVGTTEAHSVPVVVDRITTSDNKTKKDVAIKTKEVVVDEKRAGNNNFLWGIIVTLSVAVIGLILIISRKARDALRWP
jgi:preprotein translocase subunit SecG